MQPGVQPRSTLEHVRATNRTHTERALSNPLSHAGTKQNMYTCKCCIPMQSHPTTCLFSNGVCSAIRLDHNQERLSSRNKKKPVGKTNTTDSKKDLSAQGGCNVKTLPHPHKAAEQSRQQVATFTSNRSDPACHAPQPGHDGLTTGMDIKHGCCSLRLQYQ